METDKAVCYWKEHPPFTTKQALSIEQMIMRTALSPEQNRCQICKGTGEEMKTCDKAIIYETHS